MAGDTVSRFEADLDRIESGIAVILTPGGYAWHLPEEYLPEGAAEGMTMKVTLERDPESTNARIRRINNLRSKLVNR